jgi:pyruvate kinase
MNNKTKIVATIGPASLDTPILRQMIEEGMDYIRINTSYGDINQYDVIIKNLKSVDSQNKIKIILDIKNYDILEYAIKNNITHIALSFAETANQIKKVRDIIPSSFIISKIETQIGVDNFCGILDKSNGIMIARGDLGKALSLEKIPPLQRYFIKKTIEKNKFLITATEMLLSMTNSSSPTRAEVSDVANAVFDKSSAVMLSEETAIGKYPVDAVKMMRKIITEAEKVQLL